MGDIAMTVDIILVAVLVNFLIICIGALGTDTKIKDLEHKIDSLNYSIKKLVKDRDE